MSHARTTNGRTRSGGVLPRPGPTRGGGRQVTPPEVFRRRRLVVGGLALLVVLVIVLLTAFVWPGFARPEQETPPVTVTAPPPTPTIEATGRPENQTTFLAALPDSVLQLAVREVGEQPAWVDDLSAIEAWNVRYADGDGEDAETVALVGGQWEDAKAATGAYDGLLEDAGEPTSTGDVTVDGETAGGYAVTPGPEEGQSVVTWRNGTAVFQATGPSALVEDFYSAFPL
jgi:hypothetical protein